MNKKTILLGGVLLALYLASSKPKKVIKKEQLDEGIMINEENIGHYFIKPPVYLKDIPEIYTKLPADLQVYYNPSNPNSTDGAWVYLNSDTAIAAWDAAIYYLKEKGNIYSGKTRQEADKLTGVILQSIAPDVYWKEGLMPYVYKSQFWYVWVSVQYLVMIAYAALYNLDPLEAPGKIHDDS